MFKIFAGEKVIMGKKCLTCKAKQVLFKGELVCKPSENLSLMEICLQHQTEKQGKPK